MTKPVLQVKGLHKSFGALQATKNVSLDLKPNEIHALIGPNGAGKSTLIGQIAGWITPDSGSIILDGEDVTGETVASRSQKGLGRSFQVSSLAMEVSARRNVMLSVQASQGSSFRFWGQIKSDRDLRETAGHWLVKVGLSGREDVAVSELSHGERRQVEVACALALKPKALLLDEPMAGLGPTGSVQLTEFLEEIRPEIPILLIEHDMDAVFRLADRITVLVGGAAILSGSVDEIRASALVREAYLGEEA
ncbi:Lipopolysaccharide export system ATP-binding protein LptB [Pseudovibrio axinellae]|uniref:Lipopolysaccharide export system ATP-binding protein LptB n=1 Tax=Pseudovibrio axinellae TaxID=989403 RepID=A0A165XI67_9HYPH|nr:ATP-binding cassette domain-containing protein [Pseudovibrio axinellae]KZL17724.1 Lipopolysaccharide export system ATP-binding protein LptB [Pseudovibrio axinellae]SER42207.1 amino acid/amide ABC transporter ATP-binding protein 1, HAAT family [Pseudovibrio axinellae]